MKNCQPNTVEGVGGRWRGGVAIEGWMECNAGSTLIVATPRPLEPIEISSTNFCRCRQRHFRSRVKVEPSRLPSSKVHLFYIPIFFFLYLTLTHWHLRDCFQYCVILKSKIGEYQILVTGFLLPTFTDIDDFKRFMSVLNWSESVPKSLLGRSCSS